MHKKSPKIWTGCRVILVHTWLVEADRTISSHFLWAEMEIILSIHFYPPKYAHGRSLRHILDKITKWHFLRTSNKVIWPKIFLNSMHGLKSAILTILLKYGSEEKGSSLCRCFILLGFIMSKNLRGLWFYLLIKVQNATSLVLLTWKNPGGWSIYRVKNPSPQIRILAYILCSCTSKIEEWVIQLAHSASEAPN